jgi:hypothetical protein
MIRTMKKKFTVTLYFVENRTNHMIKSNRSNENDIGFCSNSLVEVGICAQGYRLVENWRQVKHSL